MLPINPPPGPDKRDRGQTVAKAAVASIPVFGGAAAVLLEDLLPSRLEKLTSEWLKQLAEAVNRLAVAEVDTDSAEFVDRVLTASRVLNATGLENRIGLLVAALEGIAGPDIDQDDAVYQRLFRHLELLGPAHIQALRQLAELRRDSVHKDPLVPITTKLLEAGWDEGLAVDSIARDLIDAGFVDLGGYTGKLAAGTERLPKWYDNRSLLSMHGQLFLRILESYKIG